MPGAVTRRHQRPGEVFPGDTVCPSLQTRCPWASVGGRAVVEEPAPSGSAFPSWNRRVAPRLLDLPAALRAMARIRVSWPLGGAALLALTAGPHRWASAPGTHVSPASSSQGLARHPLLPRSQLLRPRPAPEPCAFHCPRHQEALGLNPRPQRRWESRWLPGARDLCQLSLTVRRTPGSLWVPQHLASSEFPQKGHLPNFGFSPSGLLLLPSPALRPRSPG